MSKSRKPALRWIPDQGDPDSVDDLFARNVDVRLERMSDGYYWMMIRVGGEDHHFDLSVPERSRTKIRAFARQPAPAPPAPRIPTKEIREQAAIILSAAAGSEGFRAIFGTQQIAEALGFDERASMLALRALSAAWSDEAEAEAMLRTGWTS